MKRKLKFIVCLLTAVLHLPAFGQNTVVTYQGRVNSDGTNFSGTGQFKFALVTVINTATTATATANLSGQFVTSYTVTDGGSGYLTPPIVTISDGGGSGATATGVISGGVVTAINPNSAGSGYTSQPTVTVAPPPDMIAYTTYWSNDGTSNAGSEPTAAVNMPVSNGLFTVGLGDSAEMQMTAFPADLFQQPNLHLRIWFNDGVNGFAALQPTQPLTAAPYALVAGSASNLLGTVSAASLSGTYSNAVTFSNVANSFSGNGAGLTALNAVQLTSGTVSDARLSANVSLLGPNISTGEIVDGTILNADLNAAAAIVDTKLATIATAGKVADSAVSANVALLNRTPQTFTGTNVFNNRVGINTATPAAALDVAGSTVIRGLVSPAGTVATNLLNLGSGFTADGFRNGISFYEGSGNPAMMLGYDGTVSGTANNALRIYDINGNVLFSFLNGGRMGIGTTNPLGALDVNGTVRATGFQGDGSSLTNLSIANGTITGAMLAKPPQSGSIASGSLAFDFGATTFSVSFSPVFSSTPKVTLSLETADELLGERTTLFIKSKSNSGFTGRQVQRQIPITIEAPANSSTHVSLNLVSGNPAIAYCYAGTLSYVLANDSGGTSWDAPSALDSEATSGFTSLAVVSGNPAVGYFAVDFHNATQLRFLRAIDASGANWGVPVTAESVVGSHPSLAVVNGNPAISYHGNIANNLAYVRANNSVGDATWNSPVIVDNTASVGEFTSLAVVNGNPAISYYDNSNGDLKYVRATDASGVTWGVRIRIDASGNVGSYTSLAIINGNPAISYYDVSNGDLKYVRATDASGSTWGTPVSVDTAGTVGQFTSLKVVNGNPAISYFDVANRSLKYVRATDVSGMAWGSPVSMDVGNVGGHTSLAMVNGKPAISYYDIASGQLKFIREASPPSFTINWIALEP